MTLDLFTGKPRPRRKPRVLMHVVDAGQEGGRPVCQMRCARCGLESDWLLFDTVTEAKRGIPCDNCNRSEK